MQKLEKKSVTYAELRRECLRAVQQWPGCETVSAIRIVRDNRGGFSVLITIYGTAKQPLADRAMRAVERETRRMFHLVE